MASRRGGQIGTLVEDHQRDGGGFGHDAPVGQPQGGHLAQRINLSQTLARRTGLVKALHVNHLVGNIGQESISSLIVEPHPGTP